MNNTNTNTVITNVEGLYDNKDLHTDLSNYICRDTLYTELLEAYKVNYIDSSQKKAKYKDDFYKTTTKIMWTLVIVGVLLTSVGAIMFSNGLVSVLSILGGLGTTISAIMVIPKIIAKHLFPYDEDANMISMVEKMQVNDNFIRGGDTSAGTESKSKKGKQ